MKYEKKLFAGINLTVLLLSVICGCTNNSGKATEIENTGIANNIETTVGDNLPDRNYGGDSFIVAIYENPDARNHVFIDEMNGETINDAVYGVTLNVEQRFNVELKEFNFADKIDTVQNSILSGDNAFQVAVVRGPDALNMYNNKQIQTYEKCEYVNLAMPWWYKSVNSNLTIEGKIYTALGCANISMDDLTHILLFNKKLIADFNLDTPYKYIRDGSWTQEVMYNMMLKVTADLDGDGKMTGSDRYGYTGYSKVTAQNFWIAAGELSVTKDNNDIPVIRMNEDHFINIFNSICNILWKDNIWYYNSIDYYNAMPDWEVELFSDNRALFANSTLRYIETLRNMDSDFGIIMYPKYDEKQDGYHVRLGYYNAPVIPVTNDNLEMTGIILEALNHEAYLQIRPAYINVSLKTKISRDEESADMLNMIFDMRAVDIGDIILGTRNVLVLNLFEKGGENAASVIASNINIIQANIDKVISSNPTY